jgi:chemotaxis protein MotB
MKYYSWTRKCLRFSVTTHDISKLDEQGVVNNSKTFRRSQPYCAAILKDIKRTMRKIQLILSLAVLVAVGFVGCVPQRKFAEVKSAKEVADTENMELQKQLDNVSAVAKEQGTTIETLKKSVNKLYEDTTLYGKEYRRLRVLYDKVNDLNNELLSKNEKLYNNSLEENKKLLRDLELAKEALQIKEDSLYKLEKSVKEKQAALLKAQKDLFEREVKIKELDSLLQAQRSASELLRAKLEAALMNYKNKGITVREENGKVYVSMEAQLLFPSGKTDINPDGKSAIIQLAKIIQDEKELNIIVEGHTDSDKISSGGSIPKDNWELSVLRSTEVIKLITQNSSIDPAQLAASGRSEYHPLDASDKARNRRIEIILEPNLKELYKIIK